MVSFGHEPLQRYVSPDVTFWAKTIAYASPYLFLSQAKVPYTNRECPNP
jgi:hypothetical protein